jgi:hypothetical protein
VSHDLQAVTDTEYRNPQLKNLFGDGGRFRSVNTLGPPGQDDGPGILFSDPGDRQVEGEYLRIHAQFSDLSRDQLGVLRAKIENKNLIHALILTIAVTIEKGEI